MRTSVRIRVVFAAALLATSLCIPSRASAQLTRADSAAVILAVASDFESRGEEDVAASLYRHIVDRFPGTPAAETAGARLDAASAERSQAGGEIELRVWSTLYGIWLGVAVPAALEAEGPEAYGVGLLLGGPAAFLGGRAFSRSRPVSPGQARAITWGGTWGALQGMGWANALDLGGDIRIHEGPSDRAIFASMIAGSAVGLAGGVLASRRDITPGTSTSAMLGSLWGAWFGIASSILLDLEDNTAWGTTMMGGDAGLVAGALAGSRWPLSRSRARLISVGGLIGGVGGLGIVMITQPGNDDSEIGIPLAGSIAGLVAAAAFTQGAGAEEDASGNAQATGFLPAAGALLNRSRGGDWSLSAPLPFPVREPDARTNGREVLVWKVPILNVRF